MDNHEDFLADMQAIQPHLIDYCDALTFALQSVDQHVCNNEAVYFGPVGGGVFFSGADFDRCRWWPDTNTVEARGIVAAEFGEELAENLE